MTKLGVTPGVHGETNAVDEKKDELTAVKVDPKVFTVLQPVSAPAPVIITPAPRRSFSPCRWMFLIALFASTALITFLLANMYFADQPLSKVFIVASDDSTQTPTVAPTAEAQKQDVVVLPVTNVDGGSEKTVKDNKVIDGSVEKNENEESQLTPLLAAMQARWFQQQQEAQMWRMRRIQQVMMEQQMAREMWQRQQIFAEQQRAQAMARAQWEAAREQQVRAEQWRQWWQAQQQWQAQQAQAQPQQQWNQQQWPQQQQQQQQWPQQQAQPQWQWPQWQQQQQQQQQPQQQWPEQQEQQWPQQQQWQQPQQPQQAWNQEPERPRVLFFRRIIPIHMSLPQIPERPETSEIPQPAIHDRIYQEMQRKSQGMEFNAPSRPIWTAITPTPETPTTRFDEEAAFQENLKKSLEQEAQAQSTTTGAPPSVDSSAEKKEGEVTDDGVIRDIFSALATAEKETETTTMAAAPEASTENIFKPFANEDDKEIDAAKASPSENVFKPFESEEDKKTTGEAEKSGFADFNEDGTPKEQETASDPKPTQPTEANSEPTVPVVVFEDRFPRIEERTTTSETPMPTSAEVTEEEHAPVAPTSAETTVDSDEHDPLATFLKYFEQEARRMAEMRSATAPVPTSAEAESSEVPRVVEGEAAQMPAQPAVDVPEPHFKHAVPPVVTVA